MIRVKSWIALNSSNRFTPFFLTLCIYFNNYKKAFTTPPLSLSLCLNPSKVLTRRLCHTVHNMWGGTSGIHFLFVTSVFTVAGTVAFVLFLDTGNCPVQTGEVSRRTVLKIKKMFRKRLGMRIGKYSKMKKMTCHIICMINELFFPLKIPYNFLLSSQLFWIIHKQTSARNRLDEYQNIVFHVTNKM